MSHQGSLQRIYALMIKEVLTLFKDPKGRLVLIVPPLLQLLIFAFAATLDVNNVTLAIYNQDNGKHGFELVQKITHSPTFTHILFIHNETEIQPTIDQQLAMGVLTIPQNFSRQLDANIPSSLQFILDGRRSNAAQIVSGYMNEIIENENKQLIHLAGLQPLEILTVNRNWFNENLIYTWFTVPSLVCILSMLISLVITALSVARERELGTFEQLLVSPLKPYEILLGKTLPAILIGLAEGLLIWTAAVLLFKIPFYGSFLLMIFALFSFILSIVGIGLFISSLSKTQQQAILGSFVFMVPAVSLSGYASPIENMPLWLQRLTWFDPLRHILIAIKGLFLKNLPLQEVFMNIWPLMIIAAFTLPAAGWYFNRRME